MYNIYTEFARKLFNPGRQIMYYYYSVTVKHCTRLLKIKGGLQWDVQQNREWGDRFIMNICNDKQCLLSIIQQSYCKFKINRLNTLRPRIDLDQNQRKNEIKNQKKLKVIKTLTEYLAKTRLLQCYIHLSVIWFWRSPRDYNTLT